ncbi:MAG: NAD(P)-dependent glycerol-3-phosphate dehydrogenase [Dehalococcoidia bacterium]|nr:NAD(P)-dependent glycerol-3-phosphate dehydrogenase [Dehalococcoidia bacterium]
MAHYGVVGATSWGFGIAWLLRGNGHDVTVLTRTEGEAAALRGNPRLARLPEIALDGCGFAPAAAPPACDGYVVVVPSQSVAATLAGSGLDRRVPVLSAAKGIEHEGGRLMNAVVEGAGWPAELVSALSGPNLVHEIVRGMPAASVVASSSEREAERWQTALSGPRFRTYRSHDVVGVEVAGALKNPIAIAAGACVALGLGANAVAAVMTRGLAEITRFGVALGADPLTFQGLAGVGDLVATCYSPLSRNHRLGNLLASGKSPGDALAEIGEAVEGATTAPVALRVAAAHGVDLPITEQVAAVLAGEVGVQEAMLRLLSRRLTAESPPGAGC